MSTCRAALRLNGDSYGCERDAPHAGMSHENKVAKAYWCSDGEARSAARKGKADAQS